MIKDHGTILLANIGPLAIYLRRIVLGPKCIEKFSVRDFGRIKLDLNNFGVVYFLTAGGPQNNLLSNAGATDILPTYAYNLASSHFLYGLAAAYNVVIFVIIGGMSLVNMKLSNAFQEVER